MKKRKVLIFAIIGLVILITAIVVIIVLNNDSDDGALSLTAIDTTHSNSNLPDDVSLFTESELNLHANGTFSLRIVYMDAGEQVVYFAGLGTFTTETRGGIRGHVFHFFQAYSLDHAGNLIVCNDHINPGHNQGFFHHSPSDNIVILNLLGTLFTFTI